MLTDAQFGALLTAVLGGLTGIAGMIKWAVTRITKAMDDQSSTNLRLADAQIDLAAAFSAQRADLDGVIRWIQMHTPGAAPLEIERERTPVRSIPLSPLTPTQMRAFGHQDNDPETPPERPLARRRSEVGPPRRTPARGIQLSYRRSDSQHDEE